MKKKVEVKVEVEEEVPFGQINACGTSSSHLHLPSFPLFVSLCVTLWLISQQMVGR
jgi:hypothetical protein